MANMSKHGIVREISIDAAHRVSLHGSKCQALHGHRYLIEAHCVGPLHVGGEQDGMVMDFGFLKEEMMRHIDICCDHATILQWDDPLLKILVSDVELDKCRYALHLSGWAGYRVDHASLPHKIYIIKDAPTAENLARHWFERLVSPVGERSGHQASLTKVVVWETPNCRAVYPVCVSCMYGA